MPIQSSRFRGWTLRLAAGFALLIGGALPATAAANETADRHLPANQDPGTLEQVIYSFNERFKYAIDRDSTSFGTIETFKAFYPESYWEENLKGLTNEDGSLAWYRSQDMLALVVLYDHTANPWYLTMLGRYAEGAMAVRDDAIGKKDRDGRISPGWGTSRYGQGERLIYLVHSGLIVEPILEYAVRAPRLPGWGDVDEKKRQSLIDKCKETLLWHDYELDPRPPQGEIVYLSGREEKERSTSWQPFNRQNLLARDFYLLHELTGEPEYLERSRQLYTFFKTHIEHTPSDAYVWEYEPIRFLKGDVKVAVCDDISHASYALEPITHACRDGFVFDHDDLGRFARTFTRYIHLGDGVFQTAIGCTPQMAPRIMDRLYAWLPLSQADPAIYRVLYRWLLRNVEKPPPLAFAYLVAYRPAGSGGVDTRMR